MTSAGLPEIAILVEDARWKALHGTVKQAAEAVLASKRLKRVALNVALADDHAVQALNRDYRGKDKPTNVLSFPNGEVEEGVRQLGDVILSYDTLVREATAQKKPIKHHVTHLVIHGVLHLLGYDHEADAEAEAMEAFEIKLLARMGIANPYESA